MKTLNLYINGQVEVGTGEPGYRWVQAYSYPTEGGGYSQPLPLKEWRAMAKRDGQRVVVHNSEAEARKALAQ